MNSNQDDYYSKTYKKLQRSGLQGWGNSLIDKLIEKRVNRFEGMKILELGASSGEHLLFVSSEPTWESYTCLDVRPGVSDPLLFQSLSRTENPLLRNVSFVQGNVEKLPFENESFDLIVSTCLLAHVRDPDLVLKEIRRVVKKGGQVVIGLPADPGILNRAVKQLVTYPKMRRIGIREPKLEYAREHINGIGNLIELIKYQFAQDYLNLSYYPFRVRSWNLNLAIVVECKLNRL